MPAPIVFISSTSEDLKDYRNQAEQAAKASGFFPEMMEYFPASGHPTVEECLRKVAEAEVVIAIVAHRYGWVPADSDPKSITWLECKRAWDRGKQVLTFLVDEKHPWPAELKENYRLVADENLPEDEYNELRKEVKRNQEKLREFKAELRQHPVKFFTDASSFRALVSESLAEWKRQHPESAPVTIPGDPDTYLKWLEDDTRQIRIRGLTSRRAEPYSFGIDEIYIPLTTLSAREALPTHEHTADQHRVVLEQALSERKVVIVGDPGSGKSTFLRRTAFELCRTLRGNRPTDAQPFLSPDDRRFPIVIRIADLSRRIAIEKSTR